MEETRQEISELVEKFEETILRKIMEKVELRLPPAVVEGNTLQQSTEDELISRAKACAVLNRCATTLVNWEKRGILTPIRRGVSSNIYYDRDEVYSLISKTAKLR